MTWPTTKLLTLTRDEVVLLTDRVQNTDWGTDEQVIHAYTLLLKLGVLYLELTAEQNPPKEDSVALTEAETWLLRAKVTSVERTATDPLFGVKLLRKLYTALVAFDADAAMVLPEADEAGERMDADHRASLALWQETEKKQREDDDHAASPT